MPQAKVIPNTVARTISARTQAARCAVPEQIRGNRIKRQVMVPARYAGAYGVGVDGDCLAPAILDGDTAVLSPAIKPQPRMVVAVFFKDRRQPVVKRLTFSLPPLLSTRGGNAQFIVIVEMDNPPRTFAIPSSEIDVVHACVGVVRNGAYIALPQVS